MAALIGGGVSFGTYWGAMYSSWAGSDKRFNWRQFRKISYAAQKSFARGKEHGGWVTEDDVILNPKLGLKRTIPGENWAPMPDNAVARFHTHPNMGKGWTETFSARYNASGELAGGDLYNIDVIGRLSKTVNNQTYLRLQHLVIGRQNSYQVSTWAVMNGGSSYKSSYNNYYRYPHYLQFR